jgi:hypothetical protein
MEKMRNAYKILVRKPEGKRLFRRYMHRWEDINVGRLKEWGGGGTLWTGFI